MAWPTRTGDWCFCGKNAEEYSEHDMEALSNAGGRVQEEFIFATGSR